VSIDIAGETAPMDAYLVMPSGQPRSGIVMLQEIFGVNDAMRRKAQKFAEAGFATLVPDLFWRLSPRVDLQYSEDERKQGFALLQRFNQAKGADDTNAAAEWLAKKLGEAAPISVVGFCIGGRIAVLAAAKNPELKSVSSYYGVKLDECADALRSLKIPFQFHVGDQDAHVPAATIDAVRKIVADKPNAEIFVYPAAQHGFFNPARADVFAPDAATKAMDRTRALLGRL
jgi:carboxymethylenebutenolidase